MDQTNLKTSGSDVDLESGGCMSEEVRSKSLGMNGDKSKKLLNRVWSRILGYESLDKTGTGRTSLSLSDSFFNKNGITLNNLSRTEKLLQTMIIKQNRTTEKQPNCKKPPRPPSGPHLNAADVELVREISELAKLKRRRVERMRALKKTRKEKASFLNSYTFAMVVTILFFIFIFVQVAGHRGSHV